MAFPSEMDNFVTPRDFAHHPAHSSMNSKSKPQGKASVDRGAIRVKRPFKYIKHLGPRPRPVPGSFASPTNLLATHSSENVIRALADLGRHQQNTPRIRPPRPTRTPSTESIKLSSLRVTDKPYSQAPSRLLRSRNLNLTALDISACNLKQPPIELLYDDSESVASSQGKMSEPLTARHSQHVSSFSDSSPASVPQLLSCSFAAPIDRTGSLLTSSIASFNHTLGARQFQKLKQRSESYHGPQFSRILLGGGAMKTPAGAANWNSNENHQSGKS